MNIQKFIADQNNWIPIQTCRKFSMLHPETLSLLYHFSANTNGFALEIGPYIGGSTVAIASAKTEKKTISIEIGGSYAHPTLPSNDIIADLKKNLTNNNVHHKVFLLEGDCASKEMISKANEIVGNDKIELLFIDADGHIERDMQNYGHLLSKDCILIFDDYKVSEPKSQYINEWIDAALKEKKVEELAVVKWGTWIGKLCAAS